MEIPMCSFGYTGIVEKNVKADTHTPGEIRQRGTIFHFQKEKKYLVYNRKLW